MKPNMCGSLEIERLIDAARRGSLNAFLTKPDGTRYGAAVLTSTGKIFSAGQYSSFNHITNIHAEMAAVIMATMSGEPDIVSLALVSTSATDMPARPCGVCRQFLHEHSLRIGHSIDIYMSTYNGSHYDRMNSVELLPLSWSNRKNACSNVLPWEPLHPFKAGTTPLRFGDLVQLRGRFLAFTWEPSWRTGHALLKVKYDASTPATEGKKAAKLAHSFTQYDQYLSQIEYLGLSEIQPWGSSACVIDWKEIEGIKPLMPIASVGLEKLRPLLSIFGDNGIPLSTLAVTGSWACGLHDAGSDIDIIITIDPDSLKKLRIELSKAVTMGDLLIPNESNTWRKLVSTFGNAMELVRQGRFVETFTVQNNNFKTRCSLIYVRPIEKNVPVICCDSVFSGEYTINCTVTDTLEANYKSAYYKVNSETMGTVHVRCWHKLAGLLRVGDKISISGAMFKENGQTKLFQVDPDRHKIVWFPGVIH
jgi:cytidine deaminase